MTLWPFEWNVSTIKIFWIQNIQICSNFIDWLLQHVIERIQGSSFQKMCAEFATNLNIGPPSFAAATEFLQGAGQGQIVQQVSIEWHCMIIGWN